MQVGVLGSLVVRDGDREIVLRPKEREVLCALAVTPGRRVSDEQLLDALWGGGAPANAARSLHSHVARLRSAVGRHRIARVDGGYLLSIEQLELDAQGVRQHAATPGSLAELRACLVAWRGTPYDDLQAWPPAVSARLELEELHLTVEEHAAAAALAAEGPRVTIAELDRLAREQPLRERRWATLARALASDGRSVEALRTIERAREHLRDVAGMDPGADLQAAERDILAGVVPVHDLSSLALAAEAVPPRTVAPSPGAPGSHHAARQRRPLAVAVGVAALLVLVWAVSVFDIETPQRNTQAAQPDTSPSATLDSPPTASPASTVPATSTTDSPAHDPRSSLREVDCITFPELAAAPSDREGLLAADTLCYLLTVPQRRTSTGGSSTVDLHVVRQPGSDVSATPVVSVDDVRDLATPAPGDHLSIALRGGPGSDPSLECAELVDPWIRALGPAGPQRDGLVDATQRCAARLAAQGIDVAAFGSREAADDIADLAALLGHDRIAIEATGGVGTWVAQRLVERHESLVETVTLRDPQLIGQVLADSAPTILAAAWNHYVGMCELDAACSAAYPDLADEWGAFSDAAGAAPTTITIQTGAAPAGSDVHVDGELLQLALVYALDIPATVPLVAGLVHQRQFQVAGQFVAGTVLSAAAMSAAFAGYSCTDEHAYANAAVADARGRLAPPFDGVSAWWDMLSAICDVWPHDEEALPDTGALVPTLVIRGAMSPYLDPGWEPAIARALPDQRVMVLPTVTFGTGATVPACLAPILSRWWSNHVEVSQGDIDACAAQSPPIAFATG